MKRIASKESPEPDIRPVGGRPHGKGLWWKAAEDRTTGVMVVNLEFCGTDHAALDAAAVALKRLSLRLQMGLTKG